MDPNIFDYQETQEELHTQVEKLHSEYTFSRRILKENEPDYYSD